MTPNEENNQDNNHEVPTARPAEYRHVEADAMPAPTVEYVHLTWNEDKSRLVAEPLPEDQLNGFTRVEGQPGQWTVIWRQPPTPVPSGDNFISMYADWADIIEAPRKMHEAMAIQIISSLLNRNGVTIPQGALTHSLDLWILLLSASGGGRNTVIGMARNILKQADLIDLVHKAHWGSPQAAYQAFADCPHALFEWGELSAKLKDLDDKRYGGLKAWITDRYDEFGLPEDVVYRKTGKKSGDTPAITFTSAPRINILAGSSEEWFFNNLKVADAAGGFVPRWTIFRDTEPPKYGLCAGIRAEA
jgi:hypothetical protein